MISLLQDKNFVDVVIRIPVKCQKLIMVAAHILQNGFLPLKVLFRNYLGCFANILGKKPIKFGDLVVSKKRHLFPCLFLSVHTL